MSEIELNPNNQFIFTFVRMNPPTPGHLLVIDSMINKAISSDSNKIFVLLSSTIDEKNPIPCSSENNDFGLIDPAFKSTILEQMVYSYKQKMINETLNETIKTKIASLEVIIICAKGNTFAFINKIMQQYYIDNGILEVKCTFFVGEDRIDFAQSIITHFEKKDFIIKPVDRIILPREGMEELLKEGFGERGISEIPLSQISASFVRKLVKDEKMQDFFELYKDYLDRSQIEKLFFTILDGLNRTYTKPSKKKGGKKTKKVKKVKKVKTKKRNQRK